VLSVDRTHNLTTVDNKRQVPKNTVIDNQFSIDLLPPVSAQQRVFPWTGFQLDAVKVGLVRTSGLRSCSGRLAMN
jgi:hypothetical protein